MKAARFVSIAAMLCILLGTSVLLSGCRSSSPDPSGSSSHPDASPTSSGTTTSKESSGVGSGLPDSSQPQTSMPVSSVPESSEAPESSASSSQPPVSSAPAETFSFNLSDVTIRKAGNTYRVYSGSVSANKIKWRSKNPAIATIDNGVITAVSAGTTTVYAEYNGTKLSCIVRCLIPPVSSQPAETVTFSAYDITIRKTGIGYRVYNGSVSADKIKWSSKNPAIATIYNGVVTAVSSGTTTVYAEYNGTRLSCIVRCKLPAPASSAPTASKPASSSSASSTAKPSAVIQPGITTGTLNQLRNTYIYKAMKKLNSKADFTNPDAYGETAYSKAWESADGFEETRAGLPDYAEMKKQGICCAGFVNYYLFNYLPNVAGISPGLTWQGHPNNASAGLHASQIRASSTSWALNHSNWTKTYSTTLALNKDYSYIEQDFAAGKLKYHVGDVLTMSWSGNIYHHVAVYAGYYNGQHWLIHSTDTPKGVGVTLTPFNGYSLPRDEFTVYVTEIFTP